MTEDVCKSACIYASEHGWPIVQVYGIDPVTGFCTCHMGRECAAPGKHPVHGDWLAHATKDEDVISAWFEGFGDSWNIGLPLGPASGLADTEWDNDQALATAKRFGLLNIPTIGYSSSRGGHRLWLLDQRLMSVPKAKIDLDGLEIRIGGGGKMSQSIIPPSRHHSGARYRWDTGRSPDEIDAAPMPEALVLAVLAKAGGGGGGEGVITKDTIYQRKLRRGERHTGMVAWISSEIMRMRDPHDPAEQQNVLLVMRSLNQTQVEDPLHDRELREIWMGQLRWGMKARAAGAVKVASTDPDAEQKVEECRSKNVHAASGLEFRSGEWFPGMWKLTVVHGDPKEFRIHVPVVANSDGASDDYVHVSLSSADWSSPISVARKILEATGTIDVTDPNPKEWAKIWNGYSFKREGEKAWTRVRGLKVKLMDEKTEEWPAAEQKRFCQVAGYLLDGLASAVVPDGTVDDTQPHPSGRPAWVRGADGEHELWFSWNRVWEDIHKNRKVLLQEGEKVALKRRMLAASGEPEFRVERHKTPSGVRRRYVVWTQRHITHLEDIAHPDSARPQTGPLYGGGIEIQKSITSAGTRVCGQA